MASQVTMMDSGQCEACGAISGHLRGCERIDRRGHAIGKKVRKRTKADRAYLEQQQKRVTKRDQRCRMCGGTGHHHHHRMTENDCLAEGWPWRLIDSADNLVLVCFTCHGSIHSAAGFDDAVAEGFLIPRG